MNFYFACPSCGNNELFTKPKEEKSDLGCALLVFGGLLPALLYANHRQGRVQCARCGYVFQQPGIPNTPVATFARWILGLTLLLVIGWALLLAGTAGRKVLPAFPVLRQIEDAVSADSRLAAYLVATLLTLNLLLCCVAAGVSNFRSNKRLAKVYRLHALTPWQMAELKHAKAQVTVDEVDQKNADGAPAGEPNRESDQ